MVNIILVLCILGIAIGVAGVVGVVIEFLKNREWTLVAYGTMVLMLALAVLLTVATVLFNP